MAPPAVASVTLSPATATLEPAEVVRLVATARDAGGAELSGRVAAWSSSNVAVATVSPQGEVTGVAPGDATITVSIEGKSATGAITVRPPSVATVVVSLGASVIEVGAQTAASAALRDVRGGALTGRRVTWSSLSPTIATVDSSGVARGIAAGSTTITATAEGKSGTATLTVTPAAIASLTVSLGTAQLNVTGTTTASAVAKDARGVTLVGRTVSWASSDPTVATVGAAGEVRGVAPGTTVISASAEGKSASAALLVWSNASVFSIKDTIVVVQYPQIWDVHPRFDPVNYPNPRVQPAAYNMTRVLGDLAAYVDPARYDFVAMYSMDSVPGWINSGSNYGNGARNIGINNSVSLHSPPAGWPRLRSAPHMNSLYYINNDPNPVRHQLSTLVLFHEIGHLWGVFITVNGTVGPREWVPGQPVAWLAGVNGHWAFNWTTTACPCPVGILTSGASDVRFNAFDLYAMGLMGYDEVKTQRYTVYEVVKPFGPNDPTKPHPVTVDSLIDNLSRSGAAFFTGNGHRIPDTETWSRSVNTLLTIVMGRDQQPSAELVNRLMTVARDATPDWATATWGRSQMNIAVVKR